MNQLKKYGLVLVYEHGEWEESIEEKEDGGYYSVSEVDSLLKSLEEQGRELVELVKDQEKKYFIAICPLTPSKCTVKNGECGECFELEWENRDIYQKLIKITGGNEEK